MKGKKFKKGDSVEHGGEVYTVQCVPGDVEYDNHRFISSEEGIMLEHKKGFPWYWVFQKHCRKLNEAEIILRKLSQ